MAEYKKLSLLISDNSEGLRKQLLGKKLPVDAESIQQLCVNYVGKLTAKDSVYMNQLSLLEQDLLTPVLKVMDTLYASDMELSKKVSDSMRNVISQMEAHQHVKVGHDPEASIAKKYGKEYTPAFVGAAGGTIIGSLCRPGSWGVILLGSVISAIVGKVLYDLYIDNSDGEIIAEVGKAKTIAPEYQLRSSDVENIVAGLVSAGDCVDNVLLIYRRHIEILQEKHGKDIGDCSLDKKFVDILECLQTVIGNLESSEKTPIVKDSIKQIVNALANQGFKVVHYSNQDRAYFEENPGDCEDYEEFKPAILRIGTEGGNAVLKGEVLIAKTNK